MSSNPIAPIEPVARELLGEPNASLSKGAELRFGTHGSLAVDLEKDVWCSHEEQAGGGVLDLIARETGISDKAAQLQWLEERGLRERRQTPEKPKRKRARIAEEYDYVDENGELVFQALRMEPKSFRQRRPFHEGWSWKLEGKAQLTAGGSDWGAPSKNGVGAVVELPPLKRVPYRLPALLADQDSTLFIVEGEKDVHRLEGLGLLATCNAGGAGKWTDELSQYLAGRHAVILPDNDEPGRDHARKVKASLEAAGAEVKVVPLPGLPEKGDVSDWLDAGGDVDQLLELVEQAGHELPEALAVMPEPARPFRALGYSEDSYFYLPRGTEQVSVIARGAHTSSSNMLALAALEWWESNYPKSGPAGGVDWQLAASECMRQCERAGVYDARNIRGRGAWYDSGESVLHLGDRLIVAGEVRQIAEHQSRHIYTRQAPMESIIDAHPATDEECREVFDVIQKLNWSIPLHGWLMAGFAFLAPICGALKWRPHVWLTSQRGAGKTWTQDNIIRPLLGQSVLVVQGSTTEAGIRQALRQDARPVMFDEAESEDAAAQRRMKGVIELARQSSSDSSAEIAKGTVGGGGMSFRARSMFLMGSINVSLSSAADETRFSVLSLEPPKRTPEGIQEFKALQKEVVSTLASERCAATRARAYHLIPLIRKNAETMGQAVAERLGSQRLGDQIGTLLAGAMAMRNQQLTTLEEARRVVAKIDLEDAQEAEAVSDELMCLQTILQHQVSVETGSRRVQRALSELVAGAASKRVVAQDFYAADCNDLLGRYGLKVAGDMLLVSNTHAEIKKILRDSPWGGKWSPLIKRIPGSKPRAKSERFAGTVTRCVCVPLSAVTEAPNERTAEQ